MQVLESNDKYMIVLSKGEPLMASLTKFSREQGVKGGRIHGIGALKKVELGYYLLEEKRYIRKSFQDADYELISLHGNISDKEGQPFVHAHVSLGREDFSVFGGHLFEAEVAVTAELFITPLGDMPTRHFNEEIGLHLIACQY